MRPSLVSSSLWFGASVLSALFAAGCVLDATEAPAPVDEDVGVAEQAVWTGGTLGAGTLAFATVGASGTQAVGVQSTVGGVSQIQPYLRSGAGAFAPAPLLVGATLPASAAVDAAGNLVVAWGTGSLVAAAHLPVGGGAWTTTTLAATPSKAGASLDVDGRGYFTAAWVETPVGTTDCIVHSAYLDPSGWSAPATVSAAGQCAAQWPSLGSNATGSLVAAWVSPSAAGIYTSTLPQITVATRTPAGVWAAPTIVEASSKVSNTYYGGLAGAGLSAAGDVTVVWFNTNRGRAAYKAAASSTYVTQNLGSYGFGRIEASAFAMNPAGAAVAAFKLYSFNQATDSLRTVSRPAGGVWGSPAQAGKIISGAAGILLPKALMSPTGTALLTWAQWNNGTGGYNVRATTRPAAGVWSNADALGKILLWAPIGVGQGTGTALLAWTDDLTQVDFTTSALP